MEYILWWSKTNLISLWKCQIKLFNIFPFNSSFLSNALKALILWHCQQSQLIKSKKVWCLQVWNLIKPLEFFKVTSSQLFSTTTYNQIWRSFNYINWQRITVVFEECVTINEEQRKYEFSVSKCHRLVYIFSKYLVDCRNSGPLLLLCCLLHKSFSHLTIQ